MITFAAFGPRYAVVTSAPPLPTIIVCSVDVPGPTAVHLSRAGRGERLDGDNLSLFEDIVAVRNVRDAFARVEKVPLHRMPGQVSDRPESVRLDRPLDPLADCAGGDARMDGFDRGLKCKLGGPDESGPVPRADLDGLGGVRDPTVLLRPQVQLHNVPPTEPEVVVVGGRVMSRDVVDRNARREGGSETPPGHESLDLLGELPEEPSFVDELDRALAGFSGHLPGVKERIAPVRIHTSTLPEGTSPAAGPLLSFQRGRRRMTRRQAAWLHHRCTGRRGPRIARGPPHTCEGQAAHDGSRWSM